MKKVNNFFWYCAGANLRLLDRCPTDSGKYVGIGATIFFTGLFAAFAAGYALFTVFDNYILAGLLGFVWGLMIFNLDRFIVSSMRKSTRGKEFVMAIPRIVLAVLISIVIAKPLELKIFEKEIKGELLVMQAESKAHREDQINLKYSEQRTPLLANIQRLKGEIVKKEESRDELNRIAQQEADGTGGSGKRNPGPIYKLKKADADQANKELLDLVMNNQPLIAGKEAQLMQLDSLQQAELLALNLPDTAGPAARLEALSRLAGASNAIWLANFFIILLFIVVETSPIIVKLLSSKGPYDHLLENAEYAFEMESYKNKAFIHHGIKQEAEKLAQREKEFVDSRLDVRLDSA